ncbi:MAG: hypothetical protein WC515_05135 [Candidatus Omnitrophota bacterium]
MNKPGLLKAVNTALFLSALVQASTGLVFLLHIKTPYIKELFEVHEYNGALLVLLICAHITLNWGWIKANFTRTGK